MTPLRTVVCLLATLLCGMLLAGCAAPARPVALYDLGVLRIAAGSPLPPLSLATVNSSAFLDNPLMFYRLAYANDQQPQQFAASRWSMPPPQLLEQRVKAQLGQAGNQVVAASDGASNLPLLRLDLDEFIQIFDRPGHSHGRVTLRASIYQGRVLLAQKSFSQQQPAVSADAAGGARALSLASDALISDLLAWLASVPLKKS